MAVGKLLRSCGLRLGTVKWRGVMIRAGEGGVAYFVRQTPKEDDSSRIQERPPPHFKSTHGFQTPSALMSPDWIACRSFSGQTSVYLPIFLSLWASLLSSRQNSVERHLFKKELSECEITVQMPKYSVLTVLPSWKVMFWVSALTGIWNGLPEENVIVRRLLWRPNGLLSCVWFKYQLNLRCFS